jgi:hypothetical protein
VRRIAAGFEKKENGSEGGLQLVLKKRRTEVRRIAAGFEKKDNRSEEDCSWFKTKEERR